MRRKMSTVLGGAILVVGLAETAPQWPVSGAMPDEAVSVPPLRYQSVSDGTKSYRPVAPLPWGDVNRRVAPPAAPPKGQEPHAH